MRILAAEHSAPHLPFRVRNGDAALRSFNENDEHHNSGHKHEDADGQEDADVTGGNKFCGTDNAAGNANDNTTENDEGDAVADALVSNLLTEPHNEHGAGTEGHHGHKTEGPAGIQNNGQSGGTGHVLKPDTDAETLDKSNHDSQITGVLRNLTPSCLSFFLVKPLHIRAHNLQKLHDNGRGNVRHDTKRENGDVGKTAA